MGFVYNSKDVANMGCLVMVVVYIILGLIVTGLAWLASLFTG